MNWNEFAKIAMALKTSWPSFQIMPSEESKKVWFSMLQDLDYSICQNAIKQIIATSKFPPSIAEIREKYVESTSLHLPDAGEAWEEVMNGIRKYGTYEEEKALNSFSAPVRKAVKRIGFRNLCLSENIVADRAHFFKLYESIVARERDDIRIPINVIEQREKYIQAIEKPVTEIEVEPTMELDLKENIVNPKYIDNLMRKYGFRK